MSRKTFIRSLVGKADPKRHRTGRFILANFALMRGVALDDLIGHNRSQPLTSIRQIGRLFGGRDHTTIMHGIDRSKARTAA